MRYIQWIAAGAALALGPGIAGCDDAPVQVTCGDGTVEASGVCQPKPPDVTVTCAEGTELDVETNTCLPRIECARGTHQEAGECIVDGECGPGTYRDAVTGECLPEATCGAGTVLVDGECVSEAQCGSGTVYDATTGECVAVEPCLPGTIYDPDSGLCLLDLQCGDGQVPLNGLCVPDFEQLIAAADVLEPANDLNDPAFGGTAQPLVLEPIGERTIFVGRTSRPTDLDGNGEDDQDADYYTFEGTTGQALRVSLISAGLPQPWAALSGPNGYLRELPLGWMAEPWRDVVLPYDGTYELRVVPTVYELARLQIGGSEARYIGIIEEMALPSFVNVVPGSAATPQAIAGNALDLSESMLAMLAPARSAVEVRLSSVSSELTPAVLVFRRDMTLLADVVVDLAQAPWVATWIDPADDAIVVIDWIRSTGPDDAFGLDVVFAPVAEMGTVAGGRTAVSTGLNLAGNELGAWVLSVSEPQILSGVISFTGPDIQIHTDGRPAALQYDDEDMLFFAEPGQYVVFAKNDTTTVRTAATASFEVISPYNLGTLEAGAAATQIGGAELSFSNNDDESAWVVARTSVDGMLAVAPRTATGETELTFYSAFGGLLRTQIRGELKRAVRTRTRAGEPVIVRLQSGQPAVLDWTMQVWAESEPAHFDVEPNDVIAQAQDLGTLPVVTVGDAAADTYDIYTFGLPEPLGAGQSVEIQFDNLTTNSFSQTTDSALIRIYDETLQPLSSIPKETTGFFSGVIGSNSVTYIADFEGTGPFLLEVFADSFDAPGEYVLSLRVVDQPFEAEPNGTIGSPTLVPLGGDVVAFRGRAATDATDLFRIDLPADLGADESLRVRVDNMETNNGMTIALENSGGTVLMSQTSVVFGKLVARALTAGSYYVRVTGDISTVPMYRVRAEITSRLEIEPNDNAAQAQSLGVLGTEPLSIDGVTATAAPDVYTFTLDPVLGPDESIEVRMFNILDTTSARVNLYNGPDPATSPLIGYDSNWVNWIYGAQAGSGPFAVQVVGTATAADVYRLVVRRGPRAEIEPNGTQGAALNLGNLPATIVGQVDRNDTDVYAVTLSATLGATEHLRVRVANIPDASSMDVKLLAPDFVTSLAAANTRSVLLDSAAALAAGIYYVVVTQSATNASTTTTDHYRLSVEVIDVP
jgi:hypothetical protein